MLTINFTSTGALVADKNVIDWTRSCVNGYLLGITKDVTIDCGNGILIDAFRVLVKEGVINHENIQLEFKGQILPVNKDGRLNHWPNGFCDVAEELLARLI